MESKVFPGMTGTSFQDLLQTLKTQFEANVKVAEQFVQVATTVANKEIQTLETMAGPELTNLENTFKDYIASGQKTLEEYLKALQGSPNAQNFLKEAQALEEAFVAYLKKIGG